MFVCMRRVSFMAHESVKRLTSEKYQILRNFRMICHTVDSILRNLRSGNNFQLVEPLPQISHFRLLSLTITIERERIILTDTARMRFSANMLQSLV